MIILDWICNQRPVGAKRIVVMFGLGLIGHAIMASVSRSTDPSARRMSFAWGRRATRLDQMTDIRAEVENLIENYSGTGVAVDVVWSAGKAGFAATRHHLDLESAAFEDVLSLSRQLSAFSTIRPLRFHLVSSAGGLFEKQRNVEPTTSPKPLQPYGEAKLEQERQAQECTEKLNCSIYRPSSVYGYRRGGRSGLVGTLIQNAIANRTSNIFGGLSVQRDYILAGDVGRFVAQRILSIEGAAGVFLLASGKPTTTWEIVRLIERTLRRRLSVRFQAIHENTADNTFLPSCRPTGWTTTPLDVGVKKTLVSIKEDLLLDRP